MTKPMKMLMIVVFLFALFFVSCQGSLEDESSQFSAIEDFVRESLGIDLHAVQRFFVKPAPERGRVNVEIESGRKKIKLVLSQLQNDKQKFKLIFMEEVARFGTEKSYLNIRTSRGSKQQPSSDNAKARDNSQREESTIQEPQKQASPSEMNKFQNIYLQRIKNFIANQLPMANGNTMKLLASEPDHYELQVEIGKLTYLLTLQKQIKNAKEELKISNVVKLASA